MNEVNQAFNDYIEAFKKLDTQSKRDEIINSIKETIALFETLADQDHIPLHYLRNGEIKDLNKDEVSEDDFLEATIVYLEVAKNIIGEYLDHKM